MEGKVADLGREGFDRALAVLVHDALGAQLGANHPWAVAPLEQAASAGLGELAVVEKPRADEPLDQGLHLPGFGRAVVAVLLDRAVDLAHQDSSHLGGGGGIAPQIPQRRALQILGGRPLNTLTGSRVSQGLGSSVLLMAVAGPAFAVIP